MSEYTPITGELRDWFEHAYNYGTGEDMFKKVPAPWFGWKSTIEQMLDAIDSIHANLERENAALKAELDRVLGEDERATMPLPIDMNGEPIHFGDVMQMDVDSELREVEGFYKGGFLAWLNGRFVPCTASLYRHAAPDTWERILADALGCESYEVELDDGLMALVARCKALCERTKGGDAE